MTFPRLRLAFADSKLEKAFGETWAAESRRQYLLGWSLAFVVVVTMTALDPLVADPDAQAVIRGVRWAFFGPTLVLAVVIALAGRELFARVWQHVLAVGGFLTMSSVPAIGVALAVHGRTVSVELGLFGLLSLCFTMISLHTVFPARFVSMSVASLLASALDVAMIAKLRAPSPLLPFTGFWLVAANAIGMLGSFFLESYRRQDFLQRRTIEVERARSETLLRNMLPEAIAARLKDGPAHIAESHDDVSILFADIVGFTDLASRLSAAEVVAMLDELFTAFDELVDEGGLEKIKTIGDAYMVVAGVPSPRPDHADAVVNLALKMRAAVAAVSGATGHSLRVRIGIHSGGVVAGVIGRKKFAYDLWGDAVNTASRMESHGLADEIQISAATRDRLEGRFQLESRGLIQVKGKGEIETFFVRGDRG